jgi:hypothetical protein
MKEIKMTPLKVEILLWYSWSTEDFPNIDSEAAQMAIDEFCQFGILYKIGAISPCKKIGCYQSALDAYVNALLEVPLPKQIWVCEK